MKKHLFLDIDAPYRFVVAYKKWLLHHWDYVLPKLTDARIVGYRIEESTNGNAHVVIYLDKAVSEDEELHLSTALGGSIGLYLISHMRLDAYGTSRKVRFMKGKKKRPRKK